MTKRLITLFLAAAILLCACQTANPSSSSEPELVSSQEPEQFVPEMPEMSEFDWWANYIYDACYPLQGDYPSKIQFDTFGMLEYAALKAHRDNALQLLGKASLSGDDLMSKEVLGEYTRRYFNVEIDELDIKQMENEDGTALVFYVNTSGTKPGENPADETLTHEAFILEDVVEKENGRFEIKVGMTYDGDDQKTYFTMAPHADASGYYIEQIRQDWGPRDPAVQFEGTYTEKDTLLFQDGRHGLGSTYSCGEIGGKVLINWNYFKSGWLLLSLVSTDDMSEETYEMELQKGEEVISVGTDENQILIQTTKRVVTMGPDFSNFKEIELPPEFLAAFADGEMNTLVAFSSDLKKAAFTTEYGIELYDFDTKQITQLAKHPNYDAAAEGKDMMSFLTYGNLRFTENDTKLMATIYGYEHIGGRFIYDLKTGESVTHESSGGWYDNSVILGDLAFSLNEPNEDYTTVSHMWTNLATGENGTLKMPDESPLQYFASNGETVLAMIGEGETDGYSHKAYRLHALNLETKTFEPKDFVVKGIDPQLIAAAKNGKIMLVWYSFDGGTGGYVLGG